MEELDEEQLRALRRRARLATLDALRALGGQAQRRAVRDRALQIGGFTARELEAPPPAAVAHQHAGRVPYELSWALTNLKREGLVVNPVRGMWALAGEAAAPPPVPLAAPVLGTRLEQLRAMPYPEYLRSPEWRETRGAALVRVGHACSLDAGHTDRLEVHHRTYDRVGVERPEDVIVLCRDCHRHHHRLVGRPRRRERAPASVAPPPPRAVSDASAVSPAELTRPPAPKRHGWLQRLLG